MTDERLVKAIGDELYEHEWQHDVRNPSCACGWKPDGTAKPVADDHVDHQARRVINILRNLEVIS